jgi:hypothetical protein
VLTGNEKIVTTGHVAGIAVRNPQMVAIDCPFLSSSGGDPVAGMPNSGSISGRTSFEPHHGKGPTGWHIDLKPSQAAGRRFGSQARRTLSTLRPTPQRIHEQLDDMHQAGLS